MVFDKLYLVIYGRFVRDIFKRNKSAQSMVEHRDASRFAQKGWSKIDFKNFIPYQVLDTKSKILLKRIKGLYSLIVSYQEQLHAA